MQDCTRCNLRPMRPEPSDDRVSVEASVIIPTYNRSDILERVLCRITDQSYPCDRFEVVVVDDGSTDNTGSMVASFESSVQLRYLRQEHRGPAAARNYGVREARGGVIIFLDSDIQVNRDFVAEHMKVHSNRRGLVGRGLVINTENQDNPFVEKKKLTDMSTAFFATGNVSVRKEYLVEVGLFDEDFREYGWEDLELGVRLKKLGLAVISVSGAIGYHYQRKPRTGDLSEICSKERMRGRTAVLFYRKHPTFEVRCMTHMSRVFFALDRLLNPGGWMDSPETLRRLRYFERKKARVCTSFLMGLMRSHAYLEGAREVLLAEETEKM